MIENQTMIAFYRQHPILALRNSRLLMLLSVLSLWLIGALSQPAFAQTQAGVQTWRPLVIVNDQAVTAFDVQQRTVLELITRGIAPTAQAILEQQQETLEDLIDDTLKLQAAKKQGIAVDDNRVNEQLERIAQSGSGTIAELDSELQRNGTSLAALRKKFEAQMVFEELLRIRIRQSNSISLEEVEAELVRRTAYKGQYERQVSEILITLDNNRTAEQAFQMANQAVARLRAGQVRFAVLAESISEAASGVSGGDIGWLLPGELPLKLDQVLQSLQVNQISDPIITAEGLYILGVRDIRQVGMIDEGDLWTLKQLFISLPSNTTNDSTAQFKLARLAQVVSEVNSCQGFNEAMISIGEPGSGDLTDVRPESIPEMVRQEIEKVGENKVTVPIPVPNGVSVFILCSIKNNIKDQEREQIKSEILNKKVLQFSSRILRQLRQEAFIERRG